MGEVLVVTGPPGSGKSTVAAVLAERFERSALVAGDAFFAFLRRGAFAPWLPEAHEQNEAVTRAASACTAVLAASGPTVVYDGVVGPWFLPVFAAAPGMPTLHYALLLPSLATCLDRVTTRQGHGFTNVDAAARMHAEFVAASPAPRHVVDSASGRPQDVADEVLRRMAAGELVHRPGRRDVPAQ